MAQIWLTDREIAALFGLSAHAAYDQAIEANWPFRRSSDGQMRFKVSDGAAHLFMIRYARQYLAVDAEEGDDSPAEGVEASLRSARAQPDVLGTGPEHEAAPVEITEGAAQQLPGDSLVEPASAPQPRDGLAAQPLPLQAEVPVELPVEVPVQVPAAAPAIAASNGVGPNLADADYWAGIFQRAFEERMGRGTNRAPH